LRPAAVALLLAALVACDGRSQPPSAPVQADGTLDLLFFNQLDGFAEGVPCDPDSNSSLAAAKDLRDRLLAEGREAVVLVAIGNSLFGLSDPRPAKPINAALLGRGDAIIAAFAAAGLDVWVPGPVEMALDADHLFQVEATSAVLELLDAFAQGSLSRCGRTR
jgi:2',3'-cyclic-nucleotide 2'-phosphodiesterase (5'-nucleotidase family)